MGPGRPAASGVAKPECGARHPGKSARFQSGRPDLWAPLTWYQGKPAAIQDYIDQWKKPVLVGGDTPVSDGPMLFHSADVENGGLRLWINRKDAYFQQIQDMQKSNADQQKKLGEPVTAEEGWVVVKPTDIG